MRELALAFLCGVLLLQGFSELPDVHWLWLAPALVGVWPWAGRGRWLLAALAGLLWAMWQAHLALAHELPPALEGHDLILEGRIASLPEPRDRAVRFIFAVERVLHDGTIVDGPRRVRLSWYEESPPLQAGEHWRLHVRLRAPSGFSNPGGFDYEAWLLRQRLRATGYVRAGPENVRLAPPGVDALVDRAREDLAGRLAGALAGHPMHGVVEALLIGERRGIHAEQWTILNRTGTSHLVAISGLHIGLVAGLVFLAVRVLWTRSARLLGVVPERRAAAPFALIAAAIYAALAGFSIPTQRALIMVTAAMAAVFAMRSVRSGHILALALLAVLLWDPMAVLAPGFWLSFGAVAAFLYALGGRLGRGGLLAQWTRVQWVAAVSLFPLLVLFFHEASLVSPAANLLAVPVVSLIVVPLVLCGAGLALLSPRLGEWLFQAAAEVLRLIWGALAWMAELPLATWTGAGGVIALGAMTLAIALLLAPRGLPGRWLGAVLCLPLLLPQAPRPEPGTAWFTLLDVGQGLAAVVQTHQRVLVYDTGPRLGPTFDTGAAVLVPFLRSQKIRTLDALIVSHGDNDHRGGAASLLAAYPAGQILSSAPEALQPIASQRCRVGQRWIWDEVQFDILHPPSSVHGIGENDRSCVLRVQAGGHVLLLTGDIEAVSEWRLLRSGAPLRADVLVAPHHGSLSSSSAEFIETVAPRYVLYPVGYRNRWGFPRAEVQRRYEQAGAIELDTARDGAIRFHLGGTGAVPEPQRHRREARHYWHRI